ncbi:MAG TPA: transposase, partial [Candidatus Acidoferrales bacterium]|nr:transposase [Candidatus Acidoferrales bacterium]
MECNRAGDAVWSVWCELPTRFPIVELDAFVVMPNHVHGIIFLSRPQTSTGLRPAGRASPAPTRTIANTDRRGDPWVARACPPGRATPQSRDVPKPVSLGQVIGAFKSLSTAAVNRALHRTGSLWQRNYYEHIIRSGDELDAIRLYIAHNP